jgi:TatD DNase family protein
VESREFPGLVDTHCHLNFDNFNQDRDSVIERARENGISRILNPGVDIETSRSAIDCAYLTPEVFAAVGVHPNDALGWTKDSLAQIRELAGEKKVVAIGEIGLDYFRDRAPKGLQQSILRQQLELAAELELPVIIHNRDADDDLREILQAWHIRLISNGCKLADYPGVLHAFSSDLGFAKDMVSHKFKIGIAGPITFAKSTMLQSVVVSLSLNAFVIETDAPFLSPHPFRGMRNEPANVRIVAEKIAELKDETLENVVLNSASEADMLFRWREIN